MQPGRSRFLTLSLTAAALGAAGVVRPATPPTLELSASQVAALRIEPAASRSFALATRAVGSISFEEDPAIVAAEAALIAAAASCELNARELARLRGLGEGNGIAAKELEQAVANDATARAALQAARAALRALGTSAADIDRLIAAGGIAGTPGAAGTRKWALANVAESDSVAVRPGQPVSVAVMAYPGRLFTGRVTRVYAAVDPATHRVAVRAELADPANELKAGMLAEVTIRVAEPLRATAIPANGAVREADGSTSVWVTTDRRHFTQRSVTSGERSDGWVQIVAGLAAGELVVSDGAVFLSNMLQAPPSD